MIYCVRYRLKAERVGDYVEAHRQVPSEQVAALRQAGARELAIFLDGDDCLIVYECRSLARFLERLLPSAANAAWQEKMDGLFDQRPSFVGDNAIRPLPCVFSLRKEWGRHFGAAAKREGRGRSERMEGPATLDTVRQPEKPAEGGDA